MPPAPVTNSGVDRFFWRMSILFMVSIAGLSSLITSHHVRVIREMLSPPDTIVMLKEVIPDATLPTSKRDSAVVLQAQRWGVPVDLALAVSRVENYSGDSTAVSSAGAVGIMQVMPMWGPGGRYDLTGRCIERAGPPWSWPLRDQRNLTNMNLNACLAMQVLRNDYVRHGNWNAALRAYNGAITPWKGDLYVSQVVERLDFGTSLEAGDRM